MGTVAKRGTVRCSDVDKGEGRMCHEEEVFLVVVKRHAVGDEMVEVFGGFGAGQRDWR